MANIFVKDTAKALVFSSGLCFDGFAFADTDLTEDEIDEIVTEIEKLCKKGLSALMKKYGDFDYSNTESIVNAIIYEKED